MRRRPLRCSRRARRYAARPDRHADRRRCRPQHRRDPVLEGGNARFRRSTCSAIRAALQRRAQRTATAEDQQTRRDLSRHGGRIDRMGLCVVVRRQWQRVPPTIASTSTTLTARRVSVAHHRRRGRQDGGRSLAQRLHLELRAARRPRRRRAVGERVDSVDAGRLQQARTHSAKSF